MLFNRSYCLLVCCLLTFIFNNYTEAIAADTVIVKYGMLRESVSIEELNNFSQTGETSSKLEYYLKISKQNPQQIRTVLNKQIPVDGVMLSKILNNPLGGIVLNTFSQVITTPSERASQQSLRGALVTSALANDDVSIIEVLQNYPTSEVHLQGDRLIKVYQKIESILKLMS
jgi:hypothetical protein